MFFLFSYSTKKNYKKLKIYTSISNHQKKLQLCTIFILFSLIDIFRYFSLKLIQFEKFDDTTQALAAATATVEGKISKPLKKLLKRLVDPDVQEKLLVADSTLGKAIKVCDLLNQSYFKSNTYVYF